MGSDAMTSFCTELHLGHSNLRCSKPMGPGPIRASIMRDVQCEHRGRSIGMREWAGGKIGLWHATSLHLGGSVQHSLSRIDAEGGAVVETGCRHALPARGPKFFQSQKIN